MTEDFEYPLLPPTDTTPTTPSNLAAAMQDRIIMFVRGPRFKALVEALASRTDALLEVSEDIVEAFDIDTAVGVQLDRLGELLQRPRYGASDDRYRTLLKIQVELVLSSQGTTPTIMRIVELFTGEPPSSYSEHYPMAFEIGAELPDVEDTDLLLQILREATSAAYGVTLLWHDDEALILDYTDADPVDDAGTLDYTDVDTVSGAGTLGYEHVL